jgi:hypothetical protein
MGVSMISCGWRMNCSKDGSTPGSGSHSGMIGGAKRGGGWASTCARASGPSNKTPIAIARRRTQRLVAMVLAALIAELATALS